MILIVTNKGDYTADFLILELQKRGAEYFRFNTEDFPVSSKLYWQVSNNRLESWISSGKQKVNIKSVTSVWYRRPVNPTPSEDISLNTDREFVVRESRSALGGLWRNLDCLWVSHPDKIFAAEYKLFQLKVALDLEFNVSPTIVTNSPNEALGFVEGKKKGTVVYKTLDNARLNRGEKVGLIFTSPVERYTRKDFKKIAFSPSLLQNYVDKKLDLRITVIGEKVFAVEIHSKDYSKTKFDWRKVYPSELAYKEHDLPKSIAGKCVDLLKAMGLQFGAIDMILTNDDQYVFLEINPNGQWAWIQQLNPDIRLREALADLLVSGRTV